MSKQGKVVNARKPKRETTEGGDAEKSITGPGAKAHAWVTIHKLPGGGNKMKARRNVPSGPLGGSGRKTNVSRSS